jgi:uncharacterized protein
MENAIIVALITGLTAGGLSCFAVQGGLLSASIAQRVETTQPPRGSAPAARKKKGPAEKVAFQSNMIQPILLFVTAKLAAYTLLGFFLGWLGSMFSFSPFARGLIQLGIGIFLVGNALRMFNVHPIFRYFSFEPPSRVTRYIRRVSKRDDTWATPLFLGALTVLIPCGVTQSMMAVAMATGSAWLGAVIMFAFVLGTIPPFVGVSWIATSVGGMFQKYFYHAVAVIVLVLGLYSIESGLVLTESPVSLNRTMRAIQGISSAEAAFDPSTVDPIGPLPASGAAPGETSGYEARLQVENDGYSPQVLALPANRPVKLHLVTNKTVSCSRAFVIPALDVEELLPASGDVVVDLPAQAPGTSIDFMCSMGMYTGVFQFK